MSKSVSHPVEKEARERTKVLIARQHAIFNGHTWLMPGHPGIDRQQEKLRQRYLTLAENILATVERQMADWSW